MGLNGGVKKYLRNTYHDSFKHDSPTPSIDIDMVVVDFMLLIRSLLNKIESVIEARKSIVNYIFELLKKYPHVKKIIILVDESEYVTVAKKPETKARDTHNKETPIEKQTTPDSTPLKNNLTISSSNMSSVFSKEEISNLGGLEMFSFFNEGGILYTLQHSKEQHPGCLPNTFSGLIKKMIETRVFRKDILDFITRCILEISCEDPRLPNDLTIIVDGALDAASKKSCIIKNVYSINLSKGCRTLLQTIESSSRLGESDLKIPKYIFDSKCDCGHVRVICNDTDLIVILLLQISRHILQIVDADGFINFSLSIDLTPSVFFGKKYKPAEILDVISLWRSIHYRLNTLCPGITHAIEVYCFFMIISGTDFAKCTKTIDSSKGVLPYLNFEEIISAFEAYGFIICKDLITQFSNTKVPLDNISLVECSDVYKKEFHNYHSNGLSTIININICVWFITSVYATKVELINGTTIRKVFENIKNVGYNKEVVQVCKRVLTNYNNYYAGKSKKEATNKITNNMYKRKATGPAASKNIEKTVLNRKTSKYPTVVQIHGIVCRSVYNYKYWSDDVWNIPTNPLKIDTSTGKSQYGWIINPQTGDILLSDDL